MFLRFILVLLFIAALATAYFWAALSWNYSSGERAGWVQKLSKKGWLCKTWEGELAQVSVPGTAQEKFLFTIHNDAVAETVTKAMGKRVSLHYEEKVGLPSSCFGETRHYVSKVTVADEIPLATGVVVPAAVPVVAPAPVPAPAPVTAPAAAPAVVAAPAPATPGPAASR
jgi:hypothetical protein